MSDLDTYETKWLFAMFIHLLVLYCILFYCYCFYRCWCIGTGNLNQEELQPIPNNNNIQEIVITRDDSTLHPVTCHGGYSDIIRMHKILRDNPNSLRVINQDTTPLGMAMQMHHVRCVKFLLQQGSRRTSWDSRDLRNAFIRNTTPEHEVLLLVKLHLQHRCERSNSDDDFYPNYEIIVTCTVNHWNRVLQFMLEDGFINEMHEENWDDHYISIFAKCCEKLNFIAMKLLFTHGFHLNLSKSHLSCVIINKLFLTYVKEGLFKSKEHCDKFVAVLNLFKSFGVDLWNSGNKISSCWEETEIAMKLFTFSNLDLVDSSNYDGNALFAQVRTLMCVPRSLLDLSRQALHVAIGRKLWKHVPLLNIPGELKLYLQYGVTFMDPENLPATMRESKKF